tara:strand:- start:9760 stop:9960 length:201 start_codon:yes stop_codon:yes gene_type:complete
MTSISDKPVDVSEQSEKTYTITEKDIQLILKVVNVVSVRGGFKPSEFKLVGELYEKLETLTKEQKQ